MKIPARYKKQASSPMLGGMSEACLYYDQNLDRNVIIKSLQKGEELRRLIGEIKALETVRSKYVVQMYDLILDASGEPEAFVEEYIDGIELVKKGKITDFEDVVKIAHGISYGLCDIHGCNVVHRDIKPHNILIDSEGYVKIIDFGLAKNLQAENSTVGAVGTHLFMAPELFVAPHQRVTLSSTVDIYAFAITILFITDQNQIASELRSIPRYPNPNTNYFTAPIFANAKPELIALFNSCLLPDPNQRPPMSIIRDELARYLVMGKHKLKVVLHGTIYVIDRTTPARILRNPALGCSITIRYDGLVFKITELAGDVYYNNTPCQLGQIIPSSCVITFGLSEKGSARSFIPAEISHPEATI